MMNALHNICSIGVVLVQQISAIRTRYPACQPNPSLVPASGGFLFAIAKPSGRGLISNHPLPGAIRVFYSEANMISSRDLNDLHPAVKRRALAMISACDADGITLLITSTYRDNASQDKLYAQGRGGAVGPVVTNAKGGQSWHNWRLAFDIVPIVHGKPCWSTTGDAGRIWRKIGDIGKSCGLEWAGDWKRFPEFPHFQYTGGLSLADLQSGKTLRGDA